MVHPETSKEDRPGSPDRVRYLNGLLLQSRYSRLAVGVRLVNRLSEQERKTRLSSPARSREVR